MEHSDVVLHHCPVEVHNENAVEVEKGKQLMQGLEHEDELQKPELIQRPLPADNEVLDVQDAITEDSLCLVEVGKHAVTDVLG